MRGRSRGQVRLPDTTGNGSQHNEVIQNFAAAILDGALLLAQGAVGIHSVELANAMILSSLHEKTVTLPMGASEYSEILAELVAASPKKAPAA